MPALVLALALVPRGDNTADTVVVLVAAVVGDTAAAVVGGDDIAVCEHTSGAPPRRFDVYYGRARRT